MTLPIPSTAAGQLAAAVLFGAAGVALLLPRPTGRKVPLGVILVLASAVLAAIFVVERFGPPAPDRLGEILFGLFAAGALGFGTVLVAQRNPARGAIAFAFVILSTCGLFLLLAAPFLMAATVIIYAGAIIVTFLFVLMLSHAGGPSDENDRSREPLLGGLAGFAFTGLVLFTLYVSGPSPDGPVLPAPPLTPDDQATLASAAEDLRRAAETSDPKTLEALAKSAGSKLDAVVGSALGEARIPGSVQNRLKYAETDAHTWSIIADADAVRGKKKAAFDKLENAVLDPKPNLGPVRADLRALREDVILLSGRGDLPARNVANLGFALYSEHLIAVELAGTLLLVATIGAVAIARRKGAGA